MKDLINKNNLSDDIFKSLKQGILSGDVPPGTRLKQQEIAKTFNASLIPVREAFRSLEKEGLILLSANKGATVSAISSEEAAEIFEVRLILETGAILMAMSRENKCDLLQARQILVEMDTTEDVSKLSDLNRTFHECLYKNCGNQRLVELIAKQYETIDRYMRLYLREQDNSLFSQNLHHALVLAIKDGNEREVVSLLKSHMITARDRLVEDIHQRREE